MKILICFLLAFTAYSQEHTAYDLYLVNFATDTDEVYTNANKELVTFSKTYCDVKLKPQIIDLNSDEFIGVLSAKKKKYQYYIKRIFHKDTVYKIKEFSLLEKYDTRHLVKLRFKKIPTATEDIFAPCSDGTQVFTNVVMLIGFGSGAVVVLSKKGGNLHLSLVDQNCDTMIEEDYTYSGTTYYRADELLILLWNGRLIVVDQKD